MKSSSVATPAGRSKPAPAPHHRVYVVELAPEVLDVARMRAENPDHRPDRPPLYVGQTGHTPEERFAKHKAGVKANGFVRDHGLRLRPDLYEHLPPMEWEQSLRAERRLAEGLRRRGYAVWSK